MGVIDRFLGVSQGVGALGSAATGMAEVFTQNATRKMELEEQAYARAINQLGQEFQIARPGFFDSFINGLNRLPRPLLALGTMGLFVYAMVEPAGFGIRINQCSIIRVSQRKYSFATEIHTFVRVTVMFAFWV